MSEYLKNIKPHQHHIDLDFWKNPEGVSVPDDELSFLLVPDAVESAACMVLAKQVHAYQEANRDQPDQVTKSLMVTMGGLLPSVLLFDHLVEGKQQGISKIEFGTIGVSLYKGPGERYENPLVQHGISIPISGETVLVIDDLGDGGGTLKFLTQYVLDSGAHKVLNLVLYMKPKAKEVCAADFYFGETPQHTWIITPRERVETLMKRVPVWKQRGATVEECYRRLVDLIGYSKLEVDYYLPRAFNHGNDRMD
jgi:hypoxanthine phosphoribosyltransferase